MDWKYGRLMLEQGDIDSLDEWSDDKEYVLGTMDQEYDYLWREDDEGIHFVDKLFSDFGNIIGDTTMEKRRETNELILHFKNYKEAIDWIKAKKGSENKEMNNNETGNELITLMFTKEEATTMGQILMEAISKRTYEPDNVMIEWLWLKLNELAEQMSK